MLTYRLPRRFLEVKRIVPISGLRLQSVSKNEITWGMRYRRFGRTELAMPVISCGGMRYQFKWQDVPPGEIPPDNQANLEATIHRAVDLKGLITLKPRVDTGLPKCS